MNGPATDQSTDRPTKTNTLNKFNPSLELDFVFILSNDVLSFALFLDKLQVFNQF